MKTLLKTKTILAVLLVFGLLFAFGACTQSNVTVSGSDTASDAASASESDTSASAEKGTLVMATNAEFPPYEYYEGGEIIGIDAEIAGLIADKLEMNLEISDMAFDSIIAAVQSGKADFGMAGMTVTEDRQVSVDFSTTYATGKQVIIVKEDSDIASPDDLEGKIIGVQQSTTGDLYITWDYVDAGLAEIQRYNKGADAVLALTQDKVDAVVIDNEPAKVFVSENPGLKILETEYVTEEYAIAVAKDNSELLGQINTALADLDASGELQAILDKYIKAD